MKMWPGPKFLICQVLRLWYTSHGNMTLQLDKCQSPVIQYTYEQDDQVLPV